MFSKSKRQKKPPEVFHKADVPISFAKFNGKHRVSFLIKLQTRLATLIKKRLLHEVCEVFKNNFFNGTPPVAASVRCPLELGMKYKNTRNSNGGNFIKLSGFHRFR